MSFIPNADVTTGAVHRPKGPHRPAGPEGPKGLKTSAPAERPAGLKGPHFGEGGKGGGGQAAKAPPNEHLINLINCL